MSRSSGIAVRATTFTVLTALVSLAVAFGLFYFAWQSFVVELRTDELARQVSAIGRGLEAGDAEEGREADALSGPRGRLLDIQAGLIDATLLVTDGDGVVTRSTDAQAPVGELELDLEALDPSDVDGVRSAVRDGGAGRVVVVATELDQGGWLVAAQPLREVVQAQQGIWLLLGASLAVALIIALAAGTVLARRLTAPLLRLEEAAEAVTAGEWGRQVEVEGDDEVASLARSFNEMSERVARAYEAQKSFVGDVSHELRTPITSIRGWSEALLDGTVSEPVQIERSLNVIAQEALRLSELTSALLELSDLDAGVVEFERARINVPALLEAVDMRHALAADEAGVELVVASDDARQSLDDESASVPLGDQDRLLQALTVLVDNALAYTPQDGVVRVSVGAEGDLWLVAVDDSGPGVPPESREAVFERFARLETSRSTTGGGSGIGLAMCRRLVEAMDGTVGVTDSELGGARFEIRLPIA